MEKEKYESIATKVSAKQKKQLDLVLAKLGTNIYEWFQLMAEVTIRMADQKHNLSDMMSKLIQMFEMVAGWKSPCTFFDPNADSEIRSALYFIQQKGKKGMKPVLTQREWFDGNWQMTENVADIVEMVIEVCMPKSYHMLRRRMADMDGDCNRVFEVLLKLADEATGDRMQDEIAEMFDDNTRHDWGGNIEYGARTKRVKHRSPDEYIQQGILNFESNEEKQEQAAEASAWVESAEGKDWLNNINEEYDGLG